MVNILFTASWLQIRHQRILKPFGITPQQFNVLRILRGQFPAAASVSLIQERMIDRSSNASRLVEKLFAKKFVDRKTCPEDRRQVDVRITQKGLDLLSQLDKQMNEFDARLKHLSEKEANDIADMLDKYRG